MEIITENLEELFEKLGYAKKKKYSDDQANELFNYWSFFCEKEKEIKQLTGVSLETILYSKYYWCTRFKNRFDILYGVDVGLEQQQYKIIEEIEQKVHSVDWTYIQSIEENENLS